MPSLNIYPIGNKIAELIKETGEDYIDVPMDDPSEYKTQQSLSELPPGGHGFDTIPYDEDEEITERPPISATKVQQPMTLKRFKNKNKKLIVELPPKRNLKEHKSRFRHEQQLQAKQKSNNDPAQNPNLGAYNQPSDEDSFASQLPGEEKTEPNIYGNQTGDPNDMAGLAQGQDPAATDPNAMMGGTDPNSELTADPNAAAGLDPNAAMTADPNALGQDPNAALAADPNAALQGTNPAMGAAGMSGQMGVDPLTGMNTGITIGGAKTAEQVGRIYELKKIYYRLVAINKFLYLSSDLVLIRLKSYVSKALDIFETLIFNLDSFLQEQGKVDDAIVMFYKFIKEVYYILDRFYKIKSKEKNIKPKAFDVGKNKLKLRISGTGGSY